MINKDHRTSYSIGIDVGGTKMSAVLFDGKKVLADYTLATPKDNIEHFMIMLDALISPLLEKAKSLQIKINGIGIGVPVEAFDEAREKIINCRNVPILNNIRLVEKVNVKYGLPVFMDNDTNCFVRAEAILGAGQKYKNIYGIILGTGIGGAWWMNNDIYRGANGRTGEPGHMIIDFKDSIDMEEAYHRLTQNNPKKLSEEAYYGDILAERVFEELGNILGTGFVNIINLIDPEVIIIGGGAVKSSDLYISTIKKVISQHIVNKHAHKPNVIKGKLHELAGAMGAGLLGLK